MKISKYQFRDLEKTGWNYSPVEFKNINLLVGGSSSGKSSLLYTIFNLGRIVARAENVVSGSWDVSFSHEESEYRWILEADSKNATPHIQREQVSIIKDGVEQIIVDRTPEAFIFNEKQTPKLPISQTSISLLRNEERVRPIFDGFCKILRRLFDKNALEHAVELSGFPNALEEDLTNTKDTQIILNSDISLSAALYLLSKHFPDKFEKICDTFQKIFPFITNIALKQFSDLEPRVGLPGLIPVFCIREKHVAEWIKVQSLSSGMIKVLLILTDIELLTNGTIYLIDEYENSLGINAIEFLPEYLLETEKDMQFFITSHHPYIINKFPLQNWYVFHRRGSEVQIDYGEQLIDRYGKSKQQAFTKLINDPIYREGVE